MFAFLFAFAQAAAPSLDALTAEAAPIALVRVEKLHAIDQVNARMDIRVWPEDEVRIAECAVERMLLGDPKVERVFVTLRVPRAESCELAIGERVVVFGDWKHRDFWPNAPTSKRLDRLAGEHLVVPLVAGVWRVRTEEARERVEWPLSIVTLPKSLDEKRVLAELPLAVFLHWLDRELERNTPSLEASVSSNALCPWHMRLLSDGNWDASNWLKPHKGKVDTAELQRLWRTIDDAHFDELPRDVGWSCCPDTAMLILSTRRRDGVHQVRFYNGLRNDATQQQRDELIRAVRVWEALPGHEPPEPIAR